MEYPNYWEAVIGCALHGKLDLVRALLALHSKADHPAFVMAENVLKTMPIYNVYGGYSVDGFTTCWKRWQLELCSNLNSKAFIVDTNLEMIMKVSITIYMSIYNKTYLLKLLKTFNSVNCRRARYAVAIFTIYGCLV